MLKELFLATRPGNSAIAAIGVFVGFSIALNSIAFTQPLAFAMLAAILVTGAGNIINDYFDEKTDTRMWKKNFIAHGKISADSALLASALLFAAGIIISLYINSHALAIALGVSALLVIYSALMRQRKFIGNLVVALGTAMTLIYGASIAQSYGTIIFLAASAFFANVAREIIKDAQDIKGDLGEKKTLPMLIGFGEIKKIVLGLYALALGFSLAAWGIGLMTGIYFIILLAVSALLFANSYRLCAQKSFGAAQKYGKYGMIAALLAFIASVI
ncbi:MAG: UbiA family prenyltransferase [archaeon]